MYGTVLAVLSNRGNYIKKAHPHTGHATTTK